MSFTTTTKLEKANKSTAQLIKGKRTEALAPYTTKQILMELAYRHRVGLLVTGYPASAMLVVAVLVLRANV